ncbi:MAG: hypothetical protein H0V92_06080 [Pseudonocardiales bacterium]|nr:hypothetical protein [Pseudonocardiales bacterium]
MTDDDDPMAVFNAESQRTIALADQLLGRTEREVLAIVDTTTPAGYRVAFIEEGADDGLRQFDLDPRRMYLFTKNGKVVRHEAGT